ncbi:division/cell wall cluster transcriptional repressor MraZ [Bengtsoniella intestinalis]|uniref:division/cell wall cluster transcriptional repressor MraZ n=1 Tax=Bengtsoniella intestinalis TaxID=3073143 RepID=UPI00391F4E22
MIGTSYHNMDAKGRLAMPAKLRESLGDSFYITIARNHSLVVYSCEDWREKEEKYSQLSSGKRAAISSLFTSAVYCEPDSQGRILLSPELRAHANLIKEVAVLGAGTQVELWEADAWRAEVERQLSSGSVFDAMEELGF